MEEIKNSLQKEMGLHIEESTATTTSSTTATTSNVAVADTETAQPASSSSAPTGAAAVMATVEVKVDPEYYRRIEETVATLALGTGRVEVLHMRILNTNPVSAPTAGHKDDHAGSESVTEATTSASKPDKKTGKKATKNKTSAHATTTTTATASVDGAELYPVPERHDEDDNSESDGDAEGDGDHPPTSSAAIITSMRELSLDHTKRSFKEKLLEGDSDSEDEHAAGIVRKNKQV